MKGCQSAQAAIEEYRRQQEAVRFSKQPRSEHTNSRTQRIGITQKECMEAVYQQYLMLYDVTNFLKSSFSTPQQKTLLP